MAALRAALAAPAPRAFAIAFGVAMAVALAHEPKFFHYDSGEYWTLSQSFASGSGFFLFDFENNGLRGYALPLVYWVVRGFGEAFTADHSLIVNVFNSAVFALIGTALAPRFAMIGWPKTRWSVTRRLALTALILAFWNGYLSYPLSDFPALALALVALIAVSRIDRPGWLLVAGLSAGLALNMRPAYLLLLPLLVGLVVWSWAERGSARATLRTRALGALALLVGLAIVALPQSLSQHEKFGSYTFVPGSSSLSGFQYWVGLRLQRYETYLGPTPKLEYVDPGGEEILNGLEDRTIGGPDGYLGILIDHPIAMAEIGFRHLVNGLDHRYTTPYVETLEGDRSGPAAAWHLLLRIAGFLIVFLALLRVLWPAARAGLGPTCWRYPVALLALSAAALPAAVETRFMLSAFLLASIVVLLPGWMAPIRETFGGPQRYLAPAVILLAAVFYALVVVSVVGGATDSLRLS